MRASRSGYRRRAQGRDHHLRRDRASGQAGGHRPRRRGFAFPPKTPEDVRLPELHLDADHAARRRLFGTLCAIDPRPAKLNNAGDRRHVKLFAELIAFNLDAQQRLATMRPRRYRASTGELRERYRGVAHDLPPAGLASTPACAARAAARPERAPRSRAHRQRTARIVRLIDDVLDFARAAWAAFVLQAPRGALTPYAVSGGERAAHRLSRPPIDTECGARPADVDRAHRRSCPTCMDNNLHDGARPSRWMRTEMRLGFGSSVSNAACDPGQSASRT